VHSKDFVIFFAASLIVTILVTVLFMLALRPMAVSVRLVDRPGGHKEHVGNVPIIGGIAMFVGVSAGLLILPDLESEYWYLIAASLLLVVVGLLDDRYGVPASVRLIAQLTAVLIMVYGGDLIMRDIGDPLYFGRIRLGPFSLIATALIFMTVINAFNLIDGLDGLAGSMAFVALLSIAATSDPGSTTFAVAGIAGAAVVGYLIFNFPLRMNRAYRAFMGDSGSTFLGIVIVWLTVSVCQGPQRQISPVTGLWFAALPLYDLFTCFVRRIASGKSPLTPGRDHFHHTLLRAGMDGRQVLGVLILIQLIYAGFGMAGHFAGVPESLMFTCWAIAGISQHRVIADCAVIYIRRKQRRREVS
jgi:UDP-GlcNAc:undecaprenyl-phosphate GlcNAc-1-phosphate transferase